MVPVESRMERGGGIIHSLLVGTSALSGERLWHGNTPGCWKHLQGYRYQAFSGKHPGVKSG